VELTVVPPPPPGSALPESAQTPTPTVACGGCFGVADVVAVVFGSVTITNTKTAVVSVVTGFNGSSVVGTSVIENTEPFTFNPTTVAAPPAFVFGSTVTFNGVTL
jgi:hypothetical protein